MKIKSALMAPILVILAITVLLASRYIEPSMSAYRENICLAIIVLQLLSLAVPSAFYIKLRGDGFVRRMRIAPMGIEKLLITLLAAFVLILGDTIIKMFMYQMGVIDGGYSVYYYYLGGVQPGVLYSIVTFALVPAVCEELLFRSVLCAEYENDGALTAVIASAALYGMFGLNFGYFPVYFFAGVMYALVMYLTRSVFASIICHLIYNLFVLVAEDTVKTILMKPQNTGFLFFALTAAFLLGLAAFLGEGERIYYGYALKGMEPEYIKNSKGFSIRKFSEALLAPSFLICALIFIVAAMQLGK